MYVPVSYTHLYGYKFVKAEGLGKIVGDDGLNIICYYEDPSGKLPVEYKVEYDWGTDYPTDTTLPTDNTKYDSIENAKEAVKNQKYDENSTSTVCLLYTSNIRFDYTMTEF